MHQHTRSARGGNRCCKHRPTLLCFFALAFAVLATHSQADPHPVGKDYQTVGAATLKVAWLRIYDAELSTPSGQYRPDEEPLLLALTYRRAIAAEKLIDKTRQQLTDRLTAPMLTDVTEQLTQMWPDVDRGDVISFLLKPNGDGVFFFNQQPIGTIENPDFNRAFIDIWLGRDSTYPKIARVLRGEP